MFYDERIENTKAKLYRKSLGISLLLAIVFITAKLLESLKFANIITEVVVLLSTIIILVNDMIKFRLIKKDERTEGERNKYFTISFKVFLVLVLFGFSISVGIAFNNYDSVIYPNIFIIYLQFVQLFYFTYNLKKNNIFINYSIIDKDYKTYYRKLFLNILKMIAIVFFVYAFSFLVSLTINYNINKITAILLINITAFISSVISIVIYYLFISFIEKLFYDADEKNSKLYISNMLIFAVIMIVISFVAYFNFKLASIIGNESMYENLAILISNILYKLKILDMIYMTLLAFLLSYTVYILNHKKYRIKGFTLLLINMVISIALSLLLIPLNVLSLKHDLLFFKNLIIYLNIINITNSLILAVGFFIMTRYLIREGIYKMINIILPLLFIISIIIKSLFLKYGIERSMILLINSIFLNTYIPLALIMIKKRPLESSNQLN